MEEMTINKLKELFWLKSIDKGELSSINTSKLEADFLAFSKYSPKRTLDVRLPELYELRGDEPKHLEKALSYLEIKSDKLPAAVDISGAFDYAGVQDSLIFFSLEQVKADHFSELRSYLNPLIEKIYTEGAELIRDFAMHDALVGKVVCKRGNLDLHEVHLFPEQFIPGPYRLSVEIDAPTAAVVKFRDLHNLLENSKKDPKEHMLNSRYIDDVVKRAIVLRGQLGSLSRYDIPKKQIFEVDVPSCVIRTESGTLFYLYSPEHKKNIAVHFGESPFLQQPSSIQVLEGKMHQNVLAHLLIYDIYKISPVVLKQRIKDLINMYENIQRKTKGNTNGEIDDVKGLIKKLETADRRLEYMRNPELKKQHALTMSPELVEFMVCPSTDDPVIHELLPRVSWNRSVRTYHNTGKFIYLFGKADDKGKVEMLQNIKSDIFFNNQQNNDVNCWLYRNHPQLCKDAGIEFNRLSRI